jgi:hypothetical protein
MIFIDFPKVNKITVDITSCNYGSLFVLTLSIKIVFNL